MDAIFHEKQEGSLCAQHCLNGLLQGQYFSPVDLAQIAQGLDEQERVFMAEGGVTTAEYQQFLMQPSSNFDDSGFFSIQVIQEAMRVWNLDLLPYNSTDARAIQARREPMLEQAFICNFKLHWFCVRKMGHQWFNLNSLLTGPELISDTFLSLFLTQLQQEGYAINVIVGDLPNCEADQLLKIMPAFQPIKPSLISEAVDTDDAGDVDSEFQRVLYDSKTEADSQDAMLQKALSLSMQGYVVDDEISIGPQISPNNPRTTVSQPTNDELRDKRLAYLKKIDSGPQTSTSSNASEVPADTEDLIEEEMLKEAMKLSMQNDDQD